MMIHTPRSNFILSSSPHPQRRRGTRALGPAGRVDGCCYRARAPIASPRVQFRGDAHGWPGALWCAWHAARLGGDAGLHARGHLRHGQGRHAGPAFGYGFPHDPGQRLPLAIATFSGRGSPVGRFAPVHRLGRSNADRQRRVSGFFAGGDQPDQRRWRHVPVAHRRCRNAPRSRIRHRDPKQTGGGRHHDARPMPPSTQRAENDRASRRSDVALG